LTKQSQDYYQVLGIARTASIAEIKRAYRRLARQYHPDINPGDRTAVETFQHITQIYEILSDPVRRAEYDQTLNGSGVSFEPNALNLTATDLYQMGIEKARSGNYANALINYNQAIELNPHLAEIYDQRGFVYYRLQNYAAAFADYNQALQINPNLASAYYHRGLTRFALGYTQAAIDDYTQAIQLDPNHAQAYHQRGLAYVDLNESATAIADLETAAQYFAARGNRVRYDDIQHEIRTIRYSPHQPMWLSAVQSAAEVPLDAWRVSRAVAFNPMGSLLPSFAKLNRSRAIAIGLLFAILFDVCFVIGIAITWQAYDDLGPAPILKLIGLGAISFINLAIASLLMRLILRGHGSVAGDCFIAGMTLLPLSLIILLNGLLPIPVVIVLGAFTFCYTVLTLYSGCSQISNLSEGQSALAVPIMLLIVLLPLLLLNA
jgi:curved DNA-binding protein CbpA